MRNLVITVMLALGLLTLPQIAMTDDHEKPANVAEVFVFTPKAGHEADLEAAVKSHGDQRAALGDPRDWQVYTVQAGDDTRSFFIRYCCFRWADQDAYEQWSYESGAAEHYRESMWPHVESMRHAYQVVDIENSHYDPSAGPFDYVGVTQWTPNPANAMSASAARIEMSQLAKAHGWDAQWLWYNTLGGPADLVLVSLFRNFADMEPPEKSFYSLLVENTSEEKARALFNDFNSGFWDSDYTIYRLRRDLSMGGDD